MPEGLLRTMSNGGPDEGPEKSRRKRLPVLDWKLIALVVFAFAFLLFLFLAYGIKWQPAVSIADSISQKSKTGSNTSRYSAVFLINSQVYFGKLSAWDSDKPILEDVYYLRTQQPIQPEDESGKKDIKDQLTLVKLGDEIHGPEDKIILNKDQILFVEVLKNDSKVVKAIQQHKASNPQK